jgi:hypothetical protein
VAEYFFNFNNFFAVDGAFILYLLEEEEEKRISYLPSTRS